MRNYIKQSKKKLIERRMGNVLIIEKDPLPEDVNLDFVINLIHSSIPRRFLSSIDSIYIGDFEHLRERDLNALYSDGAIYVTNKQTNNEDMAENIIHEISHALEEELGGEIYSDGKIESEFRAKRERMYFLLKEEGFDVELGDFLNLEYSLEFDNFLYKEVGYPMLTMLTVNLFYSPYGATSLREYFANCFEAFFYHKDVVRLKKISPNVLEKIEEISYNKENNR